MDLTTFLLVRGPHAWIGYGFVGCALWDENVGGPRQLFERPPLLDTLRVGAPPGLCEETVPGSGVFSRNGGSGRARTPRSIAAR